MFSSASATLAATLATLAGKHPARAREGMGDLIPDPDGLLDLPEGFSYSILEESGQTMSDGYRVPGRPDGMACFAGPDNTLILMRNHENSLDALPDGPYQEGQAIAAEAYDPAGMGGVTRVVVDATTFELISSNLVLIGTARNCAGGPSPWGWLSCEETVEINGEYRHGYTFLCQPDAQSVEPAVAIPAYGRFYHEAVAIDPSNNYAYLTEDRGDSCLYRFVPDAMDEPFIGQLQALKVVGEDNYNTLLTAEGEVLEVEWVDIVEPDPDEDTVRDEGHAAGAATIIRGEGIWFFEGQVYVSSTSGGPLGKGQIFRLIDGESPTLECVVVVTDTSVLENPDNITVAPWGELFIAEDSGAPSYVRWLSEDGSICDLARNVSSESEFCGVCFSPSGDALFVNIQLNGLTLVITGPFQGGDGGDGDGDGETGETGGSEDSSDEGSSEGETDETGESGGDAGLGDEDGQGCGCTVEGDNPSNGTAVALTLAAAVGLDRLLRSDHDES